MGVSPCEFESRPGHEKRSENRFSFFFLSSSSLVCVWLFVCLYSGCCISPDFCSNRKTKSFPFSALILLRRLFLLAARHSEQALSALAPQRRFRFPLQAKIEKLKVFRFPFSVFRFYLYLWGIENLNTLKMFQILWTSIW